MDWIAHAWSYSLLEKELLNEDHEPSVFKRFQNVVMIDDLPVHIVKAPSANSTKIPELPTVVMLHGMGGNMQCFAPLVQTLNAFCELLLIDLPGHGKSIKSNGPFKPELIVQILEKTIKSVKSSDIVIVGHSYGTSHSLRLALETSSVYRQVRGLVCITPPYEVHISALSRSLLNYMPTSVFDIAFRSRDRVGGLRSHSVRRMVAPTTGDGPRRQQLRINLTAPSRTVLKTLGSSIFYDPTVEGVPRCPILLLSAQEDQVCPPQNVKLLYNDLKRLKEQDQRDGSSDHVNYRVVNRAGHSIIFEQPEIVAALISGFLRDFVDERLSLEWQLPYLASLDNKWSLKNETKWRETQSVGAEIEFFKGMKVLREGDADHGPSIFENSHDEIFAIIDISREAPPYNPNDLLRIKYHKFPTVSKIPPSKSDVKDFIELVKEIRDSSEFQAGRTRDKFIAVHCHYGFNRTGFLICCFLIEELHYSVTQALDAYKLARPGGVRHPHFIDELHLRYGLLDNSP